MKQLKSSEEMLMELLEVKKQVKEGKVYTIDEARRRIEKYISKL